jgi:HAD superfamily hydrolase (TIGR01544 family)
MSEWWEAHLDLLVKSGLNKKHIDEVINSWIIKIRSGVLKFLELLYTHKIPLIILSANGLWGDSIMDYLKFNDFYTSNIEIVSNKFKFDNDGNAIWYDGRVIHVFNKWEIAFSDFPEIEQKVENRKNIILLWDSLWDPHMADGSEYNNLLKIWFYNESDDKKLNHYLEKYDVLLTWDSDGDFLNNIWL